MQESESGGNVDHKKQQTNVNTFNDDGDDDVGAFKLPQTMCLFVRVCVFNICALSFSESEPERSDRCVLFVVYTCTCIESRGTFVFLSSFVC